MVKWTREYTVFYNVLFVAYTEQRVASIKFLSLLFIIKHALQCLAPKMILYKRKKSQMFLIARTIFEGKCFLSCNDTKTLKFSKPKQMYSQFTRSEELLGQADKYLIRLPLFSLSLFNRLYVAHSMQRCAISYKLEAETTSLKSDLLNLHMIVEKARFCILIVP